MNTEELVKELVAARHRREMTQKELAERMGCHVTFVQRIEGNKGDRQVSQLFRYAEALGVKIGFYINDNIYSEVTGL